MRVPHLSRPTEKEKEEKERACGYYIDKRNAVRLVATKSAIDVTDFSVGCTCLNAVRTFVRANLILFQFSARKLSLSKSARHQTASLRDRLIFMH